MKTKLLTPIVDLLLDGFCALLIPSDNSPSTNVSTVKHQTQVICRGSDVGDDHD